MAEEIIFKVGVDTGNSASDLQSIDTELKNISNDSKKIGTDSASQFEALNKKVEAGGLTMRESAKAVKEYMSIALAAGRESPIGKAALAEAAQLQDNLGDLKQEVGNLAHDGKNMQGALQLGGSIAAGYGVVQGTMALVGSESEDLQKSMQKLMAVTTILNGVESIRVSLEKQSSLMIGIRKTQTALLTGAQFLYTAAVGSSSIALQGLNKSIMGIPIIGWILALVAALIALISWISSLMSEEDDSAKVAEQLTKSYDRQKEAIDRVSASRLKAIDNLIRQRTEEGATIEELAKLEVDKLKELEAARNQNVVLEKNAIDKKNANYRKALRNENWELAQSIRKEIEDHRGKYKNLVGQAGQYAIDLKYQKTKTDNDIAEREDKAQEDASAKWKAAEEKRKVAREKANQLRLEYEKTFQDTLIANIADENKRAIAAMALGHKRELEEIAKKYGANTELEKNLKIKQANELFKLIDEQDKALTEKNKVKTEKEAAEEKKKSDDLFKSKKAELEGRLIQIEDDFNAETELKKELALLELEEAKKNKELTEGELFKIEAEYKDKIQKLNEEQAAKEKTMRLDSVNDAIQWAEKSVNAIQELSDMAFANKMRKVEKGSKEEEKLARKQFKMNKALQLAGAIMDAGKAITASLAASPVAIGPVPNPAGIASLAFAGVTSLANIAKIAATQFESTTPPPTSEPPSIASPTEPNAPSFQPMNGTLTNGLQGASNTKVYVLDSEITAQQSNSYKVESLATMGG